MAKQSLAEQIKLLLHTNQELHKLNEIRHEEIKNIKNEMNEKDDFIERLKSILNLSEKDIKELKQRNEFMEKRVKELHGKVEEEKSYQRQIKQEYKLDLDKRDAISDAKIGILQSTLDAILNKVFDN